MSSISPSSWYCPHYQLYSDQMIRLGHGAPLWHPTPSSPEGIRIGDVGYMKRGQFCLLFRATSAVWELRDNAPPGFVPLMLSTSRTKTAIRRPYPLHSLGVRVYGAGIGASVNTPVTVAPGASINFQLSRGEGAGFLTRYDTRCTDTEQDGLLQSYIKKHYSAWVEYANDQGLGEVDLMMVSGTDSTQDFAMFAYSTSSNSLSATITADIPPITSSWASIWASWSNIGTVHYNWGPTESDCEDDAELPAVESQSPEETNRVFPLSIEPHTHVAFVRGWRLKKRVMLWPKVIRAGAEPHDLEGPPDCDHDTDNEIVSNTPQETDCFDPVFKYIFTHCAADLALLHDNDLNLISKMSSNPDDTIEMILQRFQPAVKVELDFAILARWVWPVQWKLLMNLDLDVNSRNFLFVFGGVLASPDEESLLQGDEPITFVEVLDQFLTSTNPFKASLRAGCLVALINTCIQRTILPASYMLSEGPERMTGRLPASGGFADIWPGTYNGSHVAMKVLRVSESDDRVEKRFCKEAVLWKQLSHQNILPLLGIAPSPFYMCMVSAWMSHGTVVEYVKKNPIANRLDLLVNVTNGLQYLHNLDLVYGDLKGYNILINDAERACITDFGSMEVLPHSCTIHALIGPEDRFPRTVRWQAPELLDRKVLGNVCCKLSKQSDVYALGMVILEILTNTIPFHELHDWDVVTGVISGSRPERPTVRGLSDNVWKIMEDCWHKDPLKRPSISTVLGRLTEAASDWSTQSPPKDTNELHSHISTKTSESHHYFMMLGWLQSHGGTGPLKWNASKTETGYSARVFMHDILYGEGEASTKEGAREIAAELTLTRLKSEVGEA